jgi:hypothetical protein
MCIRDSEQEDQEERDTRRRNEANEKRGVRKE